MVNLVSSFPSVEPTHSVTRYDQSQRKKVQVTQTDIVHVYNQYMGGVDKLYMICMLYKPSLRTRRWYIYIWLHPYRCSKCLVFVPTWFKNLQTERKIYSTKTVSSSLGSEFGKDGSTCQPTVAKQIPNSTKKAALIQGNPTKHVRKDGSRHMPIYNNKRQCCLHCKISFSYISCERCNVWLCRNNNWNCFKRFHEKKFKMLWSQHFILCFILKKRSLKHAGCYTLWPLSSSWLWHSRAFSQVMQLTAEWPTVKIQLPVFKKFPFCE